VPGRSLSNPTMLDRPAPDPLTDLPPSARLGARPHADRRPSIHEFFFPRSRGRALLGLALAVALPAAATIAGESWDLPFPGSIVLLSVVIATVVGRMAAGLVASLTAGALLSHYYLAPANHFWPEDWRSTLGILTFFVVALLTAALLARARSALENAQAARREAAEARRAEEVTRRRLDALSAASRALAVSFEIEDNLARAAQLGIRYLGDSARVFMPDGRGGLAMVASAERGGRPSTGTGDATAAASSEVARAFRTRRPLTRISGSSAGATPRARELALPLAIGRRTHGVLSVSRTSEMTPFTDDDIAFGEELARRMARAIENARLYHERDQIATVLQESLLPGTLPEIPGLSLAARYEAAGEAYEVGGDFYDLIDLGPDSWLFVVGDVCGKGPEAAAVMGFARASIRAAAQKDSDPRSILSTLNQALISQGWDRFVTVVCVRVDQDDRGIRARCSVGGHPRPVLIPDTGAPATVGTYGTVLGVFPDVELRSADVRLDAGDAIVLYTDGLEGVERSAEEVVMRCAQGLDGERSARAIVQALESHRRSSRREAADDLALLVISVPA
jgi:Stage II sporulation protein E (SpoIIE)/Domain of unknown function (DUF4118)/GAF domain